MTYPSDAEFEEARRKPYPPTKRRFRRRVEDIVASLRAEVERLKAELAETKAQRDTLDYQLSEVVQKADPELRAENKKLRGLLGDFLDIVHNSHGVTGWHLNGNVAEWDEFETVAEARAALEKEDKDE